MTDAKLLPARGDTPMSSSAEPFIQDGHTADAGLELRDILGILVRRKWVVLACVAASLAATGAVLYFEDPIYKAGAMFRLEDTQSALAGSLDSDEVQMLTGRTAPDFVLSQLEILHSARVLGNVVDREGLRLVSLEDGRHTSILADIEIAPGTVTDTILLAFDAGGVRASSRRVSEARAPYASPLDLGSVSFTVLRRNEEQDQLRLTIRPRERAIESLARDLLARPEEGTDVVTVDYTSTDPELAMRVVNAVVEAFRDRNIQAARQLSRRRVAFLEEQITVYDSLLIEAQATLSD